MTPPTTSTTKSTTVSTTRSAKRRSRAGCAVAISSVPVGDSDDAGECDGGAALPGSATTTRSECHSAAGRSCCCADMGFTRHARAPSVGDRPGAAGRGAAGFRKRQSTPLREYSAIILCGSRVKSHCAESALVLEEIRACHGPHGPPYGGEHHEGYAMVTHRAPPMYAGERCNFTRRVRRWSRCRGRWSSRRSMGARLTTTPPLWRRPRRRTGRGIRRRRSGRW